MSRLAPGWDWRRGWLVVGSRCLFTAQQLVPSSAWEQSPGMGWSLKDILDGQSYTEHPLEVFCILESLLLVA